MLKGHLVLIFQNSEIVDITRVGIRSRRRLISARCVQSINLLEQSSDKALSIEIFFQRSRKYIHLSKLSELFEMYLTTRPRSTFCYNQFFEPLFSSESVTAYSAHRGPTVDTSVSSSHEPLPSKNLDLSTFRVINARSRTVMIKPKNQYLTF
ncbi:LAMI_0G03708g1_1 [Lachancea mirantina]|uniref:LAMI_0G03708g1_1 n=1 Tax=Lachancea mirantina TaxID=1230905 RepID=A0A1G4K8F2_9SACH|nr:LAMI_0G03708g1_1 [Lachancea mirantina]